MSVKDKGKSILNVNCKQCNFENQYFKFSKTQLHCKICNQKLGKPTGGTYYVG